MPERLDRVTVNVPDGDVTISWATREVLMGLLTEDENAAGIRARFEAVGASRPVDLTRDERLALRDMLGWCLGNDESPELQGLTDLYIAVNRGEPGEHIVGRFEQAGGLGSEGSRWRWMHWRDRQDPNDGPQHCFFCHTNIETGAVEAAWRAVDENDVEHWGCAGCFEKLHERFGWKVERPPAS